jgi:hypothetical protein
MPVDYALLVFIENDTVYLNVDKAFYFKSHPILRKRIKNANIFTLSKENPLRDIKNVIFNNLCKYIKLIETKNNHYQFEESDRLMVQNIILKFVTILNTLSRMEYETFQKYKEVVKSSLTSSEPNSESQQSD